MPRCKIISAGFSSADGHYVLTIEENGKEKILGRFASRAKALKWYKENKNAPLQTNL